MRHKDFPSLDVTLPDLDGLDGGAVPAVAVEPASRYDGAEASQSVWATVDRRGRLTDVSISPTWRQRLDPERFADAMYAAYTDAVGRAVAGELAAGHAATWRPDPPVPADDLDPERWLAGVRDRLGRIDARLRSAASEMDSAARVRTVEVRGPNGYLTLSMRGGEVVGITGNAGAIRSANPNKLRQDVLDAFAAATTREA